MLLAVFSCLASAAAEEPDAAASATGSLVEEGNRLYDASRFRDAARVFEDAVCQAAAAGDRLGEARGWNGLSRAQWALGENARALASEERALALLRDGDDPNFAALALNNAGLALYSTGAHAEALDYYGLGLERARAPGTRALLLLNIGLVFRYQGLFPEAEAALLEALALRRAGGKPRETALVWNALGMVARVTGRYDRAIVRYEESLALRRAAGDRFGEAQTLNNLANVYGDQGEFERALAMHRRTLRLAEEISYARQIGLSHENIGAELDDLGRPAEALPEACAAAALYRKTNDRENLAHSLSNAGGYEVELGRTDEARLLLDEALAIATAVGEPELQIVALQGLAEADLAEGRAAEALDLVDGASWLARKHGFPELEWKLCFDRAGALGALGRNEERIIELSAAADTINEIRTTVGTDAGKIGFLDKVQDVFEELAVSLAAAGRDEEALEAAEAARARALADLLSQRGVAGHASARAALDEVRGAQARARSSATRGGGADAAIARLRRDDPELASFVSVDSPRISEMRDAAARLDATLVEYLSAKDACYMWVVPPGGAVHAAREAVGREELAERVRRVRRALEAAAPSSAPSRSVRNDLADLHRLLVAPVERWLPPSPDALVVLVPHGPVALAPFAALTDASGRTFLARHTFAIAPAVSVFRYTPAKASAAGRHGLVVADPAAPRDSGLPPLPGAELEAARVAARLGPGTVVLTRGGATERAVKSEASGAAVLHFATHGLISEDRPLDSSLVLAPDAEDDGYLRVGEILGMELHADLVVLSGCRTGLGRLSGDGILGFSRAFLYAGTPSIVVSQWDVSDRATAALMGRFYAEWRDGTGKARALRRAALETRRRFPNPSAWAAFVLVGDPR